MAVAIRLTDPLRTSPTQKIPGRLVSRSSGFRSGVVELSARGCCCR